VHSTDTSPNAAFRYVYNALSIGADFSASTLLVGRQEGHPRLFQDNLGKPVPERQNQSRFK